MDLITLDSGTTPKAEVEVKPVEKVASNPALSFDPLNENSTGFVSTPPDTQTNPANKFGMPEGVAAAFAAVNGETSQTRPDPQTQAKEGNSEELSKDAHSELMRLVQEDAKKMNGTKLDDPFADLA
jgi:hypothetical protein